MEIPFVGGAYAGRSSDINAQKCQNLFPVIDQVGGKVPVALMHTPGLTEFTDTGSGAGVRAMIRVLSNLYIVSGNTVYKTDTGGVITTISNTLDTTDGAIFIAQNGSYVVVVDVIAGKGYYIDTTTTTLTQITDLDFPTPTSLTFQDTYFVVTASATGRIYISASGDPTNWNALDFATAEASPDYAYVVKSLNRELWIFGDETIEIFYNSGNADFPFERIPGSVRNKGIGAIKSIGVATDSLFFLADDYSVYQGEGTNIRRISTEQIDYQIRKLSSQDKAFGFCYTQEGHEFYILTFPTEADNKTFVYDLATQMWHTRASGSSDNYHPVTCQAFFQNKNIVGHKSNGKLLYYDFSKYTDDGDTLNRIRRTSSIFNEKVNIFHSVLEIEFEAGVGLIEYAELMPNDIDRGIGSFAGSAWENVDFTLFLEANGITIGPTAADQYATLPVASAPTVVGKNYILEINYYTNASATPPYTIKSFDGTQTIGLLAAAPTSPKVVELPFNATTTGGLRIVSNGSIAGQFTTFSLRLAGHGADPEAMLRYSDDGGHTWSNENWVKIGKLGKYNNRARWKKLGRSRDRIYEVKISDPVKVVIVSADLQYQRGNT